MTAPLRGCPEETSSTGGQRGRDAPTAALTRVPPEGPSVAPRPRSIARPRAVVRRGALRTSLAGIPTGGPLYGSVACARANREGNRSRVEGGACDKRVTCG